MLLVMGKAGNEGHSQVVPLGYRVCHCQSCGVSPSSLSSSSSSSSGFPVSYTHAVSLQAKP